jgi:beta-galactosidase
VSIIRQWYEPLWARGYAIDFVHPESDLSRYPLVLVPQLYLSTDAAAQSVIDAAAAGSTVVVGYFSGAVDESDHVRLGGYPAPWQDLLGLWVEEYRPLLPGQSVDLIAHEGTGLSGALKGREWTEHVHATDADVVLSYVGGDLDGAPAVTRRRLPGIGEGTAWYISVGLEAPDLGRSSSTSARASGALPILHTPPPTDVEVAVRETETERYLFLLNHGTTGQEVDISPPGPARRPSWRLLPSREQADGAVVVPAGDVVILVSNQERTSDS